MQRLPKDELNGLVKEYLGGGRIKLGICLVTHSCLAQLDQIYSSVGRFSGIRHEAVRVRKRKERKSLSFVAINKRRTQD